MTIDNRKKALDELAALSQELGLYDGQTCPVCGVPLIAANFQYGGDEGVGGRGGVWGYCNGYNGTCGYPLWKDENGDVHDDSDSQ